MIGCVLLAIVAVAMLFGPRVLLIVAAINSWTAGVWDGWLWPILGWIFVPWTTLAYAFCILNNNGQISGDFAWLLGIGIFLDVFGYGSIRVKNSD